MSTLSAQGPVMLDLSEGARLVLSGEEWEVARFEPYLGRVRLRRTSGRREEDVTVRALVNHPDCRPSTNTAALPSHSRGRQPAVLEDLTAAQRAVLALRYAHLMETETGFRSGDPRRALGGEPRPAYDPDTTTVTQRREAKAAELRALSADEARMLGLEHVSARTLKRWAASARYRGGINGLISGTWVRRSGGHPTIVPEVREAIFAIRLDTLHRSRTDMKTKYGLVCQYVSGTFARTWRFRRT
jgi:hypothetical protein